MKQTKSFVTPFNILLPLTTVLILFTSCSSEQTNSQRSQQNNINHEKTIDGKLIITGSSTIAPLAAELAIHFEQSHPNTKVDVQTGGSSRGIADVRREVSEIGMVSRKLKETESDLFGHVLAKDGIAIIVNKENPIASLTTEQVKSIFKRETNNWKALSSDEIGNSEETKNSDKITVINKAEGRSTLEVFLHYFQLKNREIKPDIIIGDNEQGIKLVANNKNAIAYVSIGTAEYSNQLGVNIKTVALNNIEATTTNLVNNTFPLSRELNFITHGEQSTLATAFLDYALSPDAYQIVEEFGFVPIKSR